MFRNSLKVLLLLQLFVTTLWAESTARKLFCGGTQTAAIGPVWYSRHRERFRAIDDGTVVQTSKMNGSIWGVHAEYDRIRRCSLYWGVEGQWAQGKITGTTLTHSPLRATDTDWYAEGRLGWTFAPAVYARPVAILYTGIGYFREKIAYRAPTPMQITSEISFTYVPLGLFVQAWLTWGFWIGFRGEVWFPTADPVNRIHLDPLYGDYKIYASWKADYRLELPMQWNFSGCYGLRVTPFYWQIRYGDRFSFPTNFISTKTNIGGVRAELTLQW